MLEPLFVFLFKARRDRLAEKLQHFHEEYKLVALVLYLNHSNDVLKKELAIEDKQMRKGGCWKEKNQEMKSS